VPICKRSAMNKTDPSGVPAPLATVAVNVTGLPTGDVVTDAVTVTVVNESAKAEVGTNADTSAIRLATTKSDRPRKYQQRSATRSLDNMTCFQDRKSIEEYFVDCR
jgi:hypothetical protein